MEWMDTKKCFSNHMGFYLCEPLWLQKTVQAIQSGIDMSKHDDDEDEEDEENMVILRNGIAIISMTGPMMKGRSKFGGISTVATRIAIRQAIRSSEVEAIILHIDSPGGHVAGTQELADEVFKARSEKLIVAHVEDLTASAAFWVASQATAISANRTAEIGSIGTVAVIEDTSGVAEKEGVVVHVISTGEFKGAFVPGAPVPESHLDDIQRRVNALNTHFLAGVVRGRPQLTGSIQSIADGRMFIAEDAQKLKLIDSVQSMDSLIEGLSDVIEARQSSRSRDRELKLREKA